MQSEEFSPQRIDQARMALRAGTVRNLLSGLSSASPRTVASLQLHQLLGKASPPPLPEQILQALKDVKSENRMGSRPGPLLFLRTESDHPTLVDVRDFLVWPDMTVREAAINHFDRFFDISPDCFTPRTRQLYETTKGRFILADEMAWRQAAVDLFDALSDDYLCTLAAIGQCAELHCTDHYAQDFLRAALWPSVVAFDSIDLKCIAPSQMFSAISEDVERMARSASSLKNLLLEYETNYGNIPLAPPNSMGNVVKQAVELHNWDDSVWNTIWEWKSESKSIFSRYHACQVFCVNPNYVSAPHAQDLWKEIFNVLQIGGEDYNLSWKLQCNLARHLCQWIELQLPGRESERISVMSWWLAQRLMTVVADDKSALQNIFDNVLSDQTGLVAHMWEIGHPLLQRSPIRYITLFGNSMWASALATQLAPLLTRYWPTKDNLPSDQTFEQMLLQQILVAFGRASVAVPIYTFEYSMAAPINAWIALKVEGTGYPTGSLKGLLELSESLSDRSKLLEEIKKLPTADEFAGFLTAAALRIASYSEDLSKDTLWDQIGDDEWRQKLLTTAKVPIIEYFHAGLMELMVQNGSDWANAIPHFYALASMTADTPERSELLFLLTVAASVASQGTSAIRRLLQGDSREKYRSVTTKLKNQLLIVQTYCTPWLASRLRAILNALRL